MKKTLIILTIAFISSCGPKKEDQVNEIKNQCTELLNDPVMEQYYKKAYIDGWRENLESCKDDLKMLETCKEKILDNWSEAKAEIETQKMIQK